MLSYRHAFHAGNHADVLKHYVLSLVLAYTAQKDKPYWYIDTHAGAGLYSLSEGYSTKNAEHTEGIDKLLAAKNLPESLANYVAQIQSLTTGTAKAYPGSPAIAEHYARADDKMRLFELHPNDYKILCENFQGLGKQVKIDMQNGFSGIKACLPPPPRRAVVLIDPPYEDKQDYDHVVTCIKDSLKRFSNGTYIVWYPILQREEPDEMLDSLYALDVPDWLHVSLTIHAPSEEGFGMHGSGLFIINPPWTLPNTLAETMPVLTELLALDETAHFTLDSHIS
ncbi:MAG: 23S rRNA (adenine(2030)-N(6))-methyltransferase RlmJ [Methylotenera sp. 24-45-7]|jgi:23S rRNA (adenine2030-N6)-methyltransferase|nr:MAG: 23S rRNA (adenine(2030)-N(6))-methyltransferase RlmJ [Methylotenera sp. 24-45-7]OZA08356.1 MAG: 23S rRNA (adenine(2030)-N(6))-methyltransferase RlmJ [Methylotenera sp. 17-45-7]HQS43550.1 23S rRNA (adenine(2030)-N(6))-methyltransferase RlmJ [Methylotenera sp.]